MLSLTWSRGMESEGELRLLGKTSVAPKALWKGKNKALWKTLRETCLL